MHSTLTNNAKHTPTSSNRARELKPLHQSIPPITSNRDDAPNLIRADMPADHGDATYVRHSVRVSSSDPSSISTSMSAFAACSYTFHSRHYDLCLQTTRIGSNRCSIPRNTTSIAMRCRHCAPKNDMRHSVVRDRYSPERKGLMHRWRDCLCSLLNE